MKLAKLTRVQRAGGMTATRRRALISACHVAMAAFEAAPDGSGDVSTEDARDIRAALKWLEVVE